MKNVKNVKCKCKKLNVKNVQWKMMLKEGHCEPGVFQWKLVPAV